MTTPPRVDRRVASPTRVATRVVEQLVLRCDILALRGDIGRSL